MSHKICRIHSFHSVSTHRVYEAAVLRQLSAVFHGKKSLRFFINQCLCMMQIIQVSSPARYLSAGYRKHNLLTFHIQNKNYEKVILHYDHQCTLRSMRS